MVKFLAPLLAGMAMAAPSVYDPRWTAYKAKFNKQYNAVEDATRYQNYAKTMLEIAAHNERADAGLESFWQGETDHTDMTRDEVNKKNGWGKHRKSKGAQALGTEQYPCAAWTQGSDPTPTGVNWVSTGGVTVVKNQMYCGDCWAFSAAACMETSHWRKSGEIHSLSSQQLTDCSSSNSTMGAYSNDGCNGGFPQSAFYYEILNGGIETYLEYPFADQQDYCNYVASESVATYNNCVDVTVGNEAVLAAGIAQLGPVSVAIDAGLSSFHNYVSGIYYAPYCSSDELDHAVIAVGYGVVPEISSSISSTCVAEDFECTTEVEGINFKYPCIEAPSVGSKITTNVPGVDCNPASGIAGQEFYMVKNSWGPLWGMNGYIMMARNQDNNCGIATAPTYIYASS